MRVTFLLPGYAHQPVGGYRIVYEYANHLAARGHAVTVAHPWRTPEIERSLPSASFRLRQRVKIAARRASGARNELSWQPLHPAIRFTYPPTLDEAHLPPADALVATAWQTAAAIAPFGERVGEKFYLIQHYETWSGDRAQVDATWRLPLHKIMIARWLVDLGARMGVDSGDMVHIPNALDFATYRRETPTEGRPLRVAMLCSDLDWKGTPDGVRALELAKREVPTLEARLFGVGPRPATAPAWMEYCQDPPLDVLVREIYNASSVYLCPSWAEGWHLPPAEAMACGCALVSTNIGGVLDYAEEGVTALLSPARAPEALAANLLRVLRDDALRLRLASAGYDRIRTFTWERSTDQFEAYLSRYVGAAKDHRTPLRVRR